MSNLLSSYTTLSTASSRQAVEDVLQSITNASPFAVDEKSRKELISVLLSDLKSCSAGNKGRLTSPDAAKALLAVKSLGRIPAGSETISSSSNLATLLALSTAFKDQPDACNEALRCIANALLLIEQARSTWIQKDVGGGAASVDLLEKSTSPEQIFLASRILFLCTASSASAGPFIRSLVETKSHNIVEVSSNKLDLLSLSIVTGTKLAREAMTDLLKLMFNILVHYPKLVESEPQSSKQKSKAKASEDEDKVMGDYWNPKLDGFLSPLLRVFNSLPPTFPNTLAPPLTHVIHALISIPVTSTLRPMWFPPSAPSSTNRTSRSSTSNSPPAVDKIPLPGSSTSASTTPPVKDKKRMDKALSVLAAGRRSLSRSPSPLPSPPVQFDTLLRAYDLLEVSLSHYMPGTVEPDDISVRDACKAESDNTLDDLLSPLVVLITRLCSADEISATRLRDWLVPADLDRSQALESRADLLGRLLRLLSSVYHDRLKNAVGEMLFAMCDSDPSSLSAHVGYGNVAGFLFNKGIMSAPAQPSSISSSAPDDPSINPITGVVDKKTELPEMTEEEKEQEAEKLFVLFDRLEKTGAIPASQNPIRKAIAEGKLG